MSDTTGLRLLILIAFLMLAGCHTSDDRGNELERHVERMEQTVESGTETPKLPETDRPPLCAARSAASFALDVLG